MNFVVDRTQWHRGNGDSKEQGFSGLLTESGRRCCLGFVCNQCGIPDVALTINPHTVGANERKFVGAPDGINDYGERAKLPANFFQSSLTQPNYAVNSTWVIQCMTVNDDVDISATTREAAMTELFAKNGHSIKFIN